jgi:hypothetical protein
VDLKDSILELDDYLKTTDELKPVFDFSFNSGVDKTPGIKMNFSDLVLRIFNLATFGC